jgi:hypothetical protein
MTAHGLESETLREVFVYLYRCWIQRSLGEVPSKLALSPNDGFLLSQTFALYFNTEAVDELTADDLKSRVQVPLLFVAPSFPAGALGVSDLSRPGTLKAPFDQLLLIIHKKLNFLTSHKERGLSTREAYETDEWGRFSIWKARNATRLLFEPERGDLHGYAVVKNAPGDFFFRKSKSCKQEGTRSAIGSYKRSIHRTEKRTNLNFDLIYGSGEVLLLHLTVAGAGYKAFPRQTAEPQPSFP